MVPRAQPPVITNFAELKRLTLRAINSYINSTQSVSELDREGYIHGQIGRNRAANAKTYLTNAESNVAVLAILLAIFGKPNAGFMGISPGRSSKLSGLIADNLIQGASQGPPCISTLGSRVFHTEVLQAVDIFNNQITVANGAQSWSYFDKTKGMRDLLQRALLSPEFSEHRAAIKKSATKLEKVFTNQPGPINLSLLPNVTAADAYTIGATAGAFGKALPPEVGRLIGACLGERDGARLARVNKAAAQNAREERKFFPSPEARAPAPRPSSAASDPRLFGSATSSPSSSSSAASSSSPAASSSAAAHSSSSSASSSSSSASHSSSASSSSR